VHRDATTLGEACRFHLLYSAPNKDKKQGISTSVQTDKKPINAVAIRPNMVDNPKAASAGAVVVGAAIGAVVGATTGASVGSEATTSSGQQATLANLILLHVSKSLDKPEAYLSISAQVAVSPSPKSFTKSGFVTPPGQKSQTVPVFSGQHDGSASAKAGHNSWSANVLLRVSDTK
jgi:hypothetical protein